MSGSSGSNVLREYLVSLNWQENEQSKTRVRESLATMANSIVQLGKAMEQAVMSVVGGVEKIAAKAEELYWASGRLGSSVQSINQFTYAISQMGGSSSAARASLEGLAAFMRSSPGAGGALVGLGINPEALKDTVSLTTQLSKRFAEFARTGQYYRAKAYASFMGIDELTLQAMIRDAGKFGDEYQSMVKAIGLDQDRASEKATYFMQRLRALYAAVEIIFQKVGSDLSEGLGNQLERVRLFILAHSGEIVKAIDTASRVILVLGEVIFRWLSRGVEIVEKLWDGFKKLPSGLQDIIKYTLLTAFAWRVFNNILSASPIGIVLRLVGALVALYDDYETWKEGGQSLIDWSKWEPTIVKLEDAIKWLIDKLGALTTGLTGWQEVGIAVALYFATTFVSKIAGSLLTIPVLVARSIGAALLGLTGIQGSLLGSFASFIPALIARLMPLGAAVAAMWPASTQTDQQEASTPGYANRFAQSGVSAVATDPASYSRVPNSQLGALSHMQMGHLGNVGGFLNNLGLRMGAGIAAKTEAMQNVVDFFKEKGWSAAQAAGIAANLYQESSLKPDASGDGGTAYGVGQWHPDRQLAFQRLFGKDIHGSSLEEQLTFFDWELRNTENKAGGQLQTARTPEAAAVAVEGAERPAGWSANDAGPQGAIRSSIGRQIYDATNPPALRGSPSGSTSGEGDPRSNVVLNQTNNMTVTTDQGGVARHIMNGLNRQNSDLLRNMQGAVQ